MSLNEPVIFAMVTEHVTNIMPMNKVESLTVYFCTIMHVLRPSKARPLG